MTIASVGKEGNAMGVSFEEAAKWVTWARVTYGQSGAAAAAGMKTFYYSNPNRIGPGDKDLYPDDEAAFAHDCAGNRLKTRRYERYLTDPKSDAVRRNWRRSLDSLLRRPGVHIDAVLADNSGELDGIPQPPCNFDQSQYLKDTIELFRSLNFPVFYNALASVKRLGGHNYAVSPTIALNAAPNVLGGQFEGCYTVQNQLHPKAFGSLWLVTENSQILMEQQKKTITCIAMAPHSEGSADYRLYAYASFLLTYDPNYGMYRTLYRTPSNFQVEPEVQLVPLHPAAELPGDIRDLRLPTGVYAREYKDCYVHGTPVGPCASVVNSDESVSHAFPYSTYHHTLVLQGDGVMDGGTISTTGPNPPSQLPAQTGVVVFR